MVLTEFIDALATAMANELRAREREFSVYVMRALDLGLFPWHGLIEPSFLTSADVCAERDIADWKLYNFASTRSGAWPDVAELGSWMQEFYERDTTENAQILYLAAAEALGRGSVQNALVSYNKADNFYLSVFDPDDRSSRNFCS